jgi:hypothetical protein
MRSRAIASSRSTRACLTHLVTRDEIRGIAHGLGRIAEAVVGRERIELRIDKERVDFIDHRRIERVHQQPALARVRRQQHDGIGGRHVGLRERNGPPAGRALEPLGRCEQRLFVIEAVQPGAPGVAEQHDARGAEVLEQRHSGGDVEQRDFVLEPQIVAHRPRVWVKTPDPASISGGIM